MSDFKFFDSSDKAKSNIGKKLKEAVYPWKEVPVGKSFVVPRENIKFKTLRSLASLTGKKLGKRFRVIDHGENSGYEVACLPMTEEQAVAPASNVVEALNRENKK